MARPRKRSEGRPLPENMYLMPGHGKLPKDQQRFRYKLDNGQFKGVRNQQGVLVAYEEAVEIAKAANSFRETRPTSTNSINSLFYWQNKYQEWSEEHTPALGKKQSWKNSTNLMRSFAKDFSSIKVARLELRHIEPWWDNLTYDQQHNRRSAFSKWFVWMLNKGVIAENPFAFSEDRPCLISKPKPKKARLPLREDDFWAIYTSAGNLGLEYVQIAMGIAYVTMMREGDICELELNKHIVDDLLRKSINKSVGQRGSAGASHLEFDLNQHALLKKLINRARELSLVHQRCPYVLSFKPKQKRPSKTKTHTHQVLPRVLIDGFAQARKATGLFENIPKGRTPPTFHEIKGLSIYKAKQFRKTRGFTDDDITAQAAHTDGRTTDAYPASQKPNWQPATIAFDEEMIGGNF